MANDNRLLGMFNLEGIPPAPRGMPQIEVTFDIDTNGILSVSAKDRATGKEQSIQITGSSSLNKNDIERMVNEAQAHADEDKRLREQVELKNKADSLIYQTEHQIKELGDKVPGDQKLRIETAVQNLKNALKDGTPEDIEAKTEELRTETYQLSELLYKQAAAEAGGVEIIYTAPTKATAEDQIAVIDALIAQGAKGLTVVNNNAGNGDTGLAALIGAGTPATAPLALPTALLLIFRRKYPRWWFDFTAQIANFGARVGAYAALQRDEYPSTDEPQGARVEIDYPEATALNRWLPIVKWLLLVPHYIVLFFLVVGLVVTTLIAWVAILITGRYPRGLFDYAVGVQRWSTRVAGYGFWLVTDRYPPFSLR